jgi:cell division protein ZapD
VILYEYPLHERVRTYLRLEHLFKRLNQLVTRDEAIDHHFALVTMFEIMDVGARADLKSDLLKDLDKQKHVLQGYRGNPAIAEAVLEAVIDKAEACFTDLSHQTGKAGQALTENDWLMAIRSRIGIPGGTCEFDLPSYYSWQHTSSASRQTDLMQWAASLEPLKRAVALLMKLMRDAGAPQKVMVNSGQFQLNLPQGRTYLLVRLGLDENLGLSPEMSGNRMMVSIRLMRQGEDKRAHLTSDDTTMELTLCA